MRRHEASWPGPCATEHERHKGGHASWRDKGNTESEAVADGAVAEGRRCAEVRGNVAGKPATRASETLGGYTEAREAVDERHQPTERRVGRTVDAPPWADWERVVIRPPSRSARLSQPTGEVEALGRRRLLCLLIGPLRRGSTNDSTYCYERTKIVQHAIQRWSSQSIQISHQSSNKVSRQVEKKHMQVAEVRCGRGHG